MRSKFSSSILVVFAVVALIASSGCCRKPPEELGQAQAALANAKEKCAEEYAKEEYQKAYDALSMAEKYAEDRKCKDARASALEAIQLAAEAEARANEVKAELDTRIKALMEELQALMERGQTEYNELVARKAEVDRKRAEALRVAEDKEFAKYDISMSLPTATLDASIEAEGQEIFAMYEQVAAMYAEGDCNYYQVIAELEKVKEKGLPIFAKIEANMKALDDLYALIEKTLETKLAELEKAMEPKYLTAHTVVKGECLWKIAEYELVYNDPFQWPLIWWENQWTEEKVMNLSKEDRFNLIKDPDLIFPGQNLNIKQGCSQDEIDRAIKYAKNRYGTTDWRDIPDFLTDGK